MKERFNKIIEVIKNNKKLSVGILCTLVVSILTLISVSFITKNTFASPEDTDYLTITCPETVSKGSEIECSIVLNSVTMSAQGVSASYSVTDGMEFVSFVPGAGWTDYSGGSSNGFVLVNFNGATGSNLVGTVKFTISDTASSNDIYKIELLDSTIGDGGSVSITFEDVYSEIRILSDVNTLDSLTLSNGTLNETFDKNNNHYTATVEADNVTINTTKTDEKSNINSNTNNISLHYGTNNINVRVVSESGIENTYTIDIYRPYRFSTDFYTYDSQSNYIYTGDDTSEETILSNIQLPSELTADINDNKLIISYGNERLLEIVTINITVKNYSIVDEVIYIGKDLNYSEFVNNVTLNGVNIKIFDDSNNEITEGTINGNYKLNVYYNSTLLEEYIFNEEYLNINDLIVDDVNKIIKRINLNTTYESLLNNISTTGTITIKDKNGNTVNNSSKVKTGDIIEIKMSKNTFRYTISVLGDLNGDGNANLGDVGLLYRYLKGKDELEEYQVAAGDAINNGSIKVNDVSRIYRYHKGKVESVGIN